MKVSILFLIEPQLDDKLHMVDDDGVNNEMIRRVVVCGMTVM